jgi:protein-S-isoprenylcysteine O-methyltransferase Ste14
MKTSIAKFGLAILFLCIFAWFISLTNSDGWLTLWFILFIFVGLPVLILAWIDLGRTLREIEEPSLVTTILGVVFGVPQALFGIAAIICGLAIVVWVLYNSFVERQPEYSGGLLTFGLGPALTAFGWFWLRQAFSRSQQLRDDAR